MLMFVRWKKRCLSHRSWEPQHCALYAVLVENRRVDGHVRQKVIRHLASIREKHLDAVAHRESFWQSVDWNLDDLNIEPGVREELESNLAGKVPRPERESPEFAEWEE